MNLKHQGDADAAGGDAQQRTRKREAEHVFMDEDEDAKSSDTLAKNGTRRLAVIKEEADIEDAVKDGEEEDVKQDEAVDEAAGGKGLAGALKFLQVRGTLKEGIDLAGRTTDMKRSKFAGVEGGQKEIRTERTDEFGRAMTPKEAFRDLSHKFHGKRPGKTKQEKRQSKYQDESKTKRMKSSDTPLMSAEKMRAAQARSKTPYLVLNGNSKSSPRGYTSASLP